MTVESRPEPAAPSTSEIDAILWLELANGGTRDALVERLAQAHLVDGGRTAEDADSFLAKVRDRELPKG